MSQKREKARRKPPEKELDKLSYLYRYSKMTTSAYTGAVFEARSHNKVY
jgi:hypothetical protein